MINIDFYQEFSALFTEDKIKREKRFKNLNNIICSYYNIKNQGKFALEPMVNKNGIQTDIGSFEPFSKTMKLNSIYLDLHLTNTQLYEIIESLLHEPKHLKQLLEYEKNNSTYPGFYTSLPTNLGYHLQKEEDEAYVSTFNEIQEIINSHKNTSGKEKEFYNGLQEYLNCRIKEHKTFKNKDINNIKNLQINTGLFNHNFDNIINTIKQDLEPVSFLDASHKKLLPTCTKYLDFELDNNKCEIFKHSDTWYSKLETKSLIDKHSLVFGVDKSKLFISEIVGLSNDFAKYNVNKCQSLFDDVIAIKSIYEKEYNINLDIQFAKFQIRNFNKDYNGLISGLDLNIDIKDINNNVELAKIVSCLKEYLFFNRRDFNDILKVLTNSNILSNDTKGFLYNINVNDKSIEQCFIYYLSKSLASSRQEDIFKNLNLKRFDEIFSFREISYNFDKFFSQKYNNIDRTIKDFKDNNKDKFVDYVTDIIISKER